MNHNFPSSRGRPVLGLQWGVGVAMATMRGAPSSMTAIRWLKPEVEPLNHKILLSLYTCGLGYFGLHTEAFAHQSHEKDLMSKNILKMIDLAPFFLALEGSDDKLPELMSP